MYVREITHTLTHTHIYIYIEEFIFRQQFIIQGSVVKDDQT